MLEWVERVNNAKYMADQHLLDARAAIDEHEKQRHTSLANKFKQKPKHVLL